MSTYSNKSPQNMWEKWFITSLVLFISLCLILRLSKEINLPIWYDGLLLFSLTNLIYCLIIGFKKN